MWKIGMPNLGHTMEQGTVREWLRKEGDHVRKGDVLVVVETDKANFDVESPGDGVLLRIVVAEGTVVPVGATIGVVGAPGAPLPDLGPAEIRASHAARAEARAETGADAPMAGAPVGTVSGAVPAPVETVATGAPATTSAGRRQVSPVARSLAQELGVDLARVEGTGPGGLVTKEDVRRAAESPRPAPVAAAPVASGRAEAGITVVPLTSMRRTIAERMQRSWRDAPMVTLVTHADVTALLDARQGAGPRVGINDLILRATALALGRHPRLNAWWQAGELRQVRDVNLGVAVAVEDGLVVPVVREAQRKTVAEIGAEVAALGEKARRQGLGAADVADGTFTVTNLGAWGIDLFTPIINPPQVAILGVGRVNRAPRETPAGVAFVSQLALCLVFDHRAADGAGGAAMLKTLVELLGDPARVLAPAT
jgi:pyruvate dehydrogenase E2 component (dihydrolipoamide acetyltransferase)